MNESTELTEVNVNADSTTKDVLRTVIEKELLVVDLVKAFDKADFKIAKIEIERSVIELTTEE